MLKLTDEEITEKSRVLQELARNDGYRHGQQDTLRLIREKIEEKRKNNPYKTYAGKTVYDDTCQSILSLLEG